MSIYNFIATDREFNKYDDGTVIYDSMNDCILSNSSKDIDYSFRMIDDSNEDFPRLFTSKKYITYLEYNVFQSEHAKILMDFIRKYVSINRSLEIYNTYIGCSDIPLKKKVDINDFSVEDLAIYLDAGWESNRCLEIYKV